MAEVPNRLYDRVRMQTLQGQVVDLAHILWDSGEKLPVYDLSYRGIAFQKPRDFGFVKDGKKEVQLEVEGLSSPLSLVIAIKRESEASVGCEIVEVNASDLKLLQGFIEPRVQGVRLKRVHEKFYDPELGMSHWFQGTHGVDLAIWQDDRSNVSAFEFLRDGEKVEFKAGDWQVLSQRGWEDVQTEILEILSQLDSDPVSKVVQLVRERRA